MRFSRRFQASPHCRPSPDGSLVAALHASTINIRAVESLRTVREIDLPAGFAGAVLAFQWSPSSRLLLVSSVDEIHVYSVSDVAFHATVRNFAPPAAKPVYIGFGPVDADVYVCTSLGLKFAVFDLVSSRAIEVANIKFCTAATVRKGFCCRPHTRHLTVLTRLAGKDMISIHHPTTKEVQRSWYPDLIDAQGVLWSPDGRWLATWESAAQGHKILFYTPDGNLVKMWSGPQTLRAADADVQSGPGVRLLEFSLDSRSLAVGDSSRRICILDMKTVAEFLRLQHPVTVSTTDTLQVWQEQVGPLGQQFVQASHAITPPNGQAGPEPSTLSGSVLLSFDPSSALLASKIAEAPSTIWVWDVAAAELRAVLVFHGKVSNITWHPTVRETLLISCEGDLYNSTMFTWDPLSGGPQSIDFSEQLSSGKVQASWLNLGNVEPGALFASDSKEYLLASLAADNEEGPLLWPADGDSSGLSSTGSDCPTVPDDAYDEEPSELDDTFCFKKGIIQ